jgi:hypothetical protein
MNKKLLILACFALCVFFSNSAHAQYNVCTPDDYTLVATVDDNYAIKSDNGTPYRTAKSKRENVEVMFQNCSFKDFTINLNMSARYMNVILPSKPQYATSNIMKATFFNFDRVSSVPITKPANDAQYDNLAAFCGGKNPDGSILLNTANITTADNYAGCGYDATNGMYYVRRNVGSQLNNNYSLRFQNSSFDGTGTLASGTSYIKVYHPDPYSWTLAPEEASDAVPHPCGGRAHCGALMYQPKRGDKYVESYPTVPFVIYLKSANPYDYQY